MIDSFTAIGINAVWFCAVLFMLSFIFISSSVRPILKIISIILVFLLIFSTTLVWKEIQGTAKPVSDPPEMIIKSFLIREPSSNKDGKIWMWVIDENKREPLSIELPYSKKLHKELMENKKFKQGIPQKIKRKNKNKSENNTDDETPFEIIDANPRKLTK